MRTAKIKLESTINSEIIREGFSGGEIVSAEIDKNGAAWLDSKIDYLEKDRKCVVYTGDYTELPAVSDQNEKYHIPAGKMLDRIFSHQDSLGLSNKMIQLFLDNNIDRLDLTELGKRNPQAQQKWYQYHRRNNRLGAFITYTVIGR